MRKAAASMLILIALLALAGSAIVTLAKGPVTVSQNVINAPDPLLHIYLKVKGFSPDIAGGFTPAQLKKAYGLTSFPNKGAGVTVAIIDAFGNPNAQADLNTYSTHFGLPTTTITVVYPQGKPASVDQGWALETNLDIQMVHAVAPKAKIVLEAAKSATLGNLMTAVKDAYTNHGANIISMSFGGAEFTGETGASADGIFSAGNNKGVAFTASSGDNGHGAQYPAASPFVTSVGGTTLQTKADGTYVSETAWSGSGGGNSAFENRPGYQNGFNSNAKRGIPDVAMVGDPNTGVLVYDSFGFNGQTGYFIVGGTSASAPLFAGILAIVDQQRANHLKNADTQLYHVAGTHYAADFHDIISGNNGGCGTACKAGTGYDEVTGLGSPAGNKLVPDLVAAP